MAGPSPTEGIAQAVRRVRLAAGSLAGPLDAFTVVAAAAQSVPDVLNPALDKLTTPSLFGGIAGLLGGAGPAAVGAGGAGPRAVPARRQPAAAPTRPAPSAATPAGIATRATDAVAVLGRFVTDELNALAVQAAPTLIGTGVLSQVGAITGALTQPPDPAVAAAMQPAEDILTAVGAQPATPQARAGAVAAVVTRDAGLPAPAVEGARAVASTVASGVQLLEELTGTAPPPTPPQAAAPADSFGGALGALGAIVAGVGAAPSAPAKKRTNGSAPGAGAPAPTPAGTPTRAAPDASGLTTTLEQERRKLLDVIAAAEQATATAAAPQSGSATADDDVAWLVNEALVEQARLHGVDLR